MEFQSDFLRIIRNHVRLTGYEICIPTNYSPLGGDHSGPASAKSFLPSLTRLLTTFPTSGRGRDSTGRLAGPTGLEAGNSRVPANWQQIGYRTAPHFSRGTIRQILYHGDQ